MRSISATDRCHSNAIHKKRQVGVIAQEVEEILPEVVTYCDVNDEYGVAYGNIAGLFIESIKEQQKILNDCTEKKISLVKLQSALLKQTQGSGSNSSGGKLTMTSEDRALLEKLMSDPFDEKSETNYKT